MTRDRATIHDLLAKIRANAAVLAWPDAPVEPGDETSVNLVGEFGDERPCQRLSAAFFILDAVLNLDGG
ncbi:hypothetical protein ACWDLG_39535 [Nonomuraea sp. NPDC003727]